MALLVAPIIGLIVMSWIGNALWPALLRDHPLLLIALDARNRFLVLTSNKIDLAPFVGVALARRIASDPLFFALGYLYGDRAVRWVERRFAPDTGLVEWMERRFSRLAPFLVFFFPGALVCVLAGASRMRPALFGVLNVAGTIGIIVMLYAFGDVFEGPVSTVTGFVERNFRLFTALSLGFTALWLLDQRRRGKSDMGSLADAQRELSGDGGTGDGEAGEAGEAGGSGSDRAAGS